MGGSIDINLKQITFFYIDYKDFNVKFFLHCECFFLALKNIFQM